MSKVKPVPIPDKYSGLSDKSPTALLEEARAYATTQIDEANKSNAERPQRMASVQQLQQLKRTCEVLLTKTSDTGSDKGPQELKRAESQAASAPSKASSTDPETKTAPVVTIELSGEDLSPENLVRIGKGAPVHLAESSIAAMEASRRVVDDAVSKNKVIYGVTTGFGDFAGQAIAADKTKQLQVNLIRSHATGVGEPLPNHRVRMMMALRINTLAKGYSGIRPSVVGSVVDALNKNCLPRVPCQGTVGASGDLAPLAHLALGLMGEGDMWDPTQEEFRPAATVLSAHGLTPLTLAAKEGLSLINGTQFVTALGVEAVVRARQAALQADVICAMTAEALGALEAPFLAAYHSVRPHKGQGRVAARILSLIRSNGEPSELHRMLSLKKIQDAYCIRCVPQVHGVVHDTLDTMYGVLRVECNSATDNPLVFPDQQPDEKGDGQFMSGGNFHAEYPAKVCDFAAISVHELANISERRLERLVNAKLSTCLPPFLVPRVAESGLNSGFMIAHCTSASLTSENKVLVHPASSDTIPTSAGQEDHVSMGGMAARKAVAVVENVERVLAIELFATFQAFYCHSLVKATKSTEPIEKLKKLLYDNGVRPVEQDRFMGPDIEICTRLIRDGLIWETVVPYLQRQQGRSVKVPRGTKDIMPDEMVIRDKAFAIIKKVFQLHGAVSIDTPVFELKSTLLDKYGEDGGKLIYELADQGGELLALRYDLTVPFARFIAQHGKKEMKRYHIGRVYRRDQPRMEKGRFREFYQCDFDIAGDFPIMMPDAECLQVMVEILDDLDLGKYHVKVNHRKLLDAILAFCGVPTDKFRTICSAIDKLDKEPWSAVSKEMIAKGLEAKVVEKIGTYVCNAGSPLELLSKVKSMDLARHPTAKEALDELTQCFDFCQDYGCLSKLRFDLSLARGLDYYTGLIMEAFGEEGPAVGSIAGGGRYDNLVGQFCDRQVRAVGFSIGIERIFTLLEDKERKKGQFRSNYTQVLVCSVGKEGAKARMRVCSELWRAGIAAEMVYHDDPKPKRQLEVATRENIPVTVWIGSEELKSKTVKVKDARRTESTIARSQLVAGVRAALQTPAAAPEDENGDEGEEETG